jgi:FtsP/CotA-like multicopper oxidase with cupredoxin domain
MSTTLPGGRTPADEDARLDAIEEDLRKYRLSRDTWTVLVLAFAVLAALASIVGIGLALRAANDDDNGGGGVATGGESVDAGLSEYSIDLSVAAVDTPGVITVRNNGTMVHNLAIRGTDLVTPDLAPGESAELDISGLDAGTYEIHCTIPGHTEAGMSTNFVVGGDAAAAGGSTDHSGHGTPTAEEGAAQDMAMIESIMEFPAETEGRGNQPLAPEVLPDGTKRFELTASVVDWEVRPGEVVPAWAYNGMVPGPRIDLEVGDTVEIEFTNELPIGSDIHWHGIDIPNDQDGVAPITQDLVTTGQTYTYRFTVTEPAISMYHAHAHAHESVPNGLFGTLYVGDVPLPAGQTISGIDIPADLELAQDIPMVLNDAGVIGLSLDGKSFPATAPVVVDLGDWFRVTYYNEGLQVHPMHLHGTEQFVIAKDGEPLDHPYAADTVLIAPGERYTVLVHADNPGTWVWHCHILNHVESNAGMFGMVTALIVQ